MRSPLAALRPTFRWFLKSYLLVGLVVLGIVTAVMTLRVARDVDEQAQLTTRLIGRLLGDTLFSSASDEVKRQQWLQLRDAIDDVSFPFIVTTNDRPWLWNARQVGVPLPEDADWTDLIESDLENPTPATQQLLDRVRKYDGRRQPIEITQPGSDQVLALLHYGESQVSRQLLYMPLLGFALIVAFMGIALLAFRNMKRSEQRSIWVGMAKETAHQVGTPLTSLNGWLAILEDPEAVAGMDRDELMTELRRDADRLGKVSARFSRIGNKPKLSLGRVDELARQVCTYFERRLPHLGKRVRIEPRIDEVPLAPVSPDLFDWALENLVKNALDAIDKEDGRVEVGCRYLEGTDQIEVTVRDNGKGMEPDVQRRVFEPGFSTKQQGWGMGMVLVHRIVVEYHGGHIQVAESEPGVGTTMRILLDTR